MHNILQILDLNTKVTIKKIGKETLFIQELKPALNANVSSEKLYSNSNNNILFTTKYK